MEALDLTTALAASDAAALPTQEVLKRLATSSAGLTTIEGARRLALFGPNVMADRTAGPFDVMLGQFKNPLLALLAATALVALALHDRTDATIILGIVVLSVGLGFFNEYRSVRAIAGLRTHIRHTARALRDGIALDLDVANLVPGDVVALAVGDIVPADLRLIENVGLACDEATITGESLPAEKSCAAEAESGARTWSSSALAGTVVRGGRGLGVVVGTGSRTERGRIAARVGAPPADTKFQIGLRQFSQFLVWTTALVTSVVFIVNAIVRHDAIESLLFALAIAVSLTPQLLPAIVTVSLATGARRLAKRSVLVKRLVSIENLGNMRVLFTDKTGTLTDGRMTFTGALDATGTASSEVLELGLLCSSEGSNDASAAARGGVTAALDTALWSSPHAHPAALARWHRVAEAPFDYERRRMSVLVDDGTHRRIVTKGAPEAIYERCTSVPAGFRALVDARFAAGARVVAIATREAAGIDLIAAADERDLSIAGLITFDDPPKADAAASIARLERLGVTVKIVTGDNELVAQKVCADLGVASGGTLTGSALAAMSDSDVKRALATTSIFARVSPEQKARIIGLQRSLGFDVGFLGDGVNDAVALHDADVGISVESASDVAKDAADIVLVTKDLGILADGVVEGRRIFANTIKYVLMGTSSNFGNMTSAAIGSLFLPFLPLLPSQILLNNLLYDTSEMTIPTDNVDEERLQRPAHWDMRLIRRFMLVFGPINASLDFAIFAVMLSIFHAGPTLFRSGFFVESFVAQTLIVFAIRTRRVPFFRSSPSRALAVTTLAVALIGIALPFVPRLGAFFGFEPLPWAYFAILAALGVGYLALVEIAKAWFFRSARATPVGSSSDLRAVGVVSSGAAL